MGEYRQSYCSSEIEVENVTKGTNTLNKKVYPNHEHFASEVGEEDMIKELSKEGQRADISATAKNIYETHLEEEMIMQAIITQWSNGGNGYISDIKPDDVTMENVNSLFIFASCNWNVEKLHNLNTKNCYTLSIRWMELIHWRQEQTGN